MTKPCDVFVVRRDLLAKAVMRVSTTDQEQNYAQIRERGAAQAEIRGKLESNQSLSLATGFVATYSLIDGAMQEDIGAGSFVKLDDVRNAWEEIEAMRSLLGGSRTTIDTLQLRVEHLQDLLRAANADKDAYAKNAVGLRTQLDARLHLLQRSKEFVAFVVKCLVKNGEYAPLSRQEPEELMRDLGLDGYVVPHNELLHKMRDQMTVYGQKVVQLSCLLRDCMMAVREQRGDDAECEFDLPEPLMRSIDAALASAPSAPSREPFAWHCTATGGQSGKASRTVTSRDDLEAWVNHYQGIGADVVVKPLYEDPNESELPKLREQLRLAGVAREIREHQAAGRAVTEQLAELLTPLHDQIDQLKAGGQLLVQERDQVLAERNDLLHERDKLKDDLRVVNESIAFAADEKAEQQRIGQALMDDAKMFRAQRDSLRETLQRLAQLVRHDADREYIAEQALAAARKENLVIPVTDYTAKEPAWSFERLETGKIVVRNGKDWTLLMPGAGPSHERFLYRYCEALLDEQVAKAADAVQPDTFDVIAPQLMVLAARYWAVAVRERQPGAVQFLQMAESGAVLVYTRGEYAEELKSFVMSLPGARAAEVEPEDECAHEWIPFLAECKHCGEPYKPEPTPLHTCEGDKENCNGACGKSSDSLIVKG